MDLLRWWAPLAAYMGLIFWLSSRPVPEALAGTPDYLLHGGAYFVLAVLGTRAVAKGLFRPLTGSQIGFGVALAILYGMSDEWHQAHVPGRDANVWDAVSDSVGAMAAGGLMRWTSRWGLGGAGDPASHPGGP